MFQVITLNYISCMNHVYYISHDKILYATFESQCILLIIMKN